MHATAARPWTEVPRAALAVLGGVLTDIDDTLTRAGAIEPEALAALGRLERAGMPVVAITGRPMGWSEALLHELDGAPLAAIVAENGAVALIPKDGGVIVEYAQDEPTRRANARRLRAVAERVLREVPGATLARDSAGRVTDVAVDHGEFAQLDRAAVEHVLVLMREQGMTATVSSIHVNGWFGTHDKWSGAVWAVRRLFGRDLASELGRWIYVGDSANDQPLFARFPLSVGVANLLHCAAELEVWPAYLTLAERGAGFAEVADALLAARATSRQR